MTYHPHGKKVATSRHIRRQSWPLYWAGLNAILLVLCTVSMAQSPDPVPEAERILQAQRILSTLGYDAGKADGVIGPLTRQALEAFQRTYNLAPTGELDTPTLVALGLQQAERQPAVTPPAPPPTVMQAPWRVVLAYLRYDDTHPARLVPYVTEQFRQGKSPQEWIAETTNLLAEQQFYRLSWHIERVETDTTSSEPRSIVYVQSRIRIKGQERVRREIFFLVQNRETEWRISGWQSSLLSTAESTIDATPAER